MPTTATRRRRPPPPPGAFSDAWQMVRLPSSARTFAGFLDWSLSPAFPEQGRATFVDREIHIDLDYEDIDSNVLVKGAILGALHPAAREEELGIYLSNGAVIANEPAQLVTNPDASFYCRDSLNSGRVRFVPRDRERCRIGYVDGTPDWILQIVGDGSVEWDTSILRKAYHTAGVAEYWVIDARGTDIDFTVLHWRKSGYASAPVKAGWRRSKVFGRDFRLTRFEDEYGLWEYDLEQRP